MGISRSLRATRAVMLFVLMCASLCASVLPHALHAQTTKNPPKSATKVTPLKQTSDKAKTKTGAKIKQPAPKTRTPAREVVIPTRTAYFPTVAPTTATAAPKIGGDTQNPVQPPPKQQAIPEPKITTGPYVRYAPRVAKAELESRVQAATVNIVCVVTSGGVTRSSLGSGVVVSADGVILTNAHVGIYSLFAETSGTSNCVARGKSPAEYLYDLEAVYIPSSWVADYGAKLFSENLSGTGAGDYMLLKRKVSAGANSTSLAPLPFLPIETTRGSIDTGNTILGAGYPAEFLGSELIASNLTYASSYIVVGEGFTFGDNTPDTFSLGGAIIARAGISGGPAVDSWGKVVGIMSTATRAKTTAERTLRTITLEYINRDITATTSIPLEKYIARDAGTVEKSAQALTYAKNVLQGLYPH